MARVEFINVRKTFGAVEALPKLNLAISDGEFVALVGPSGCGKTTSLLLLAGLYKPTSGTLLFDGVCVNEVEARLRDVGVVFQSYALYPHMSVLGNILFPLSLARTPKPEAQERARAAAAMVHVNQLLDRRPDELSGGQQQRVALASALVKRPRVLLLDEPLSNLDASLRLEMRSEIKTLQARLGLTTILVTHDQVEATTMADRVVVMKRGRIEQDGTPYELYVRPANVFVAGFMYSPPINLLHGHVTEGHFVGEETSLKLSGDASGRMTVGLRPECLRFASEGVGGRVKQVERMGSETLYLVESELGNLRVLDTAKTAWTPLNGSVRLAFDPSDTLAFDGETGRLLPDVHANLPNAGSPPATRVPGTELSPHSGEYR